MMRADVPTLEPLAVMAVAPSIPVRSASTPSVTPACPLCRAAASDVIAVIPFTSIWTALEHNLSVTVSTDVRARHAVGDEATLRECSQCGLQFFAPCIPGDPQFYAELAAAGRYYTPSRWEFGWLEARLTPSTTVLDVGAGRGDFLASISARVARAVGVELNPDAVAVARGRGLEIHAQELDTFVALHPASFDVVCSFHVLEHVTDPVGFVRTLARAVKSGGELIISVPNRARVWREALEPLDCPPHHITRWAAPQLNALAQLLELDLEEVALEPASSATVRHAIEKNIHAALRPLPFIGNALGAATGYLVSRALVPPGISLLYEHTPLYAWSGAHGLAMIARFRRS